MPKVSLTVAAFNLYAGMDGYGRRYDVVEACRCLEADVILLEEVFTPDGLPSQAAEAASALQMSVAEFPLSPAWRLRQPTTGPDNPAWEPRRPYPRTARALRVGTYVRSASHTAEGYEKGAWGLAVLSRDPFVSAERVELGRLRRDFGPRGALVVTLSSGLTVVATHMSHLTQGSPVQFARLFRALPARGVPAVLGGDMNLWGPPLELVLPGWRRAVRSRTWPARRPLAQLDHLLVTRPVTVHGGRAVRAGDSDHLPVRAEISFLTEDP